MKKFESHLFVIEKDEVNIQQSYEPSKKDITEYMEKYGEENESVANNIIIRNKQEEYLKKVKEEFFNTSIYSKDICQFCYIPYERLDILIFYKTEEELVQNINNDVVKKIADEILSHLEKAGYFLAFSDNIRFEFDSEENVKKNFKGNYFYRLRS